MNKFIPFVFIITISTLLLSCSSHYRNATLADLPHVPIDYVVIGDTASEESRSAFLWIDWAHLFEDETGEVEGLSFGIFDSFTLVGAAKKAALYKALQRIPNADKVIEPRWEIDAFSIGIYKSVTVKLWAKAIRYTKSSPTTIIAR